MAAATKPPGLIQRYRELLQTGIDHRQREALTEATLRGWAFGGPEFVASLQSHTARRAIKASAGRPRRHLDDK